MIRKWYKYSCDNCNKVITHLTYRCVSKKEFENIGIILYENKHFCCEECKNNYINKKEENKRKDFRELGSAGFYDKIIKIYV